MFSRWRRPGRAAALTFFVALAVLSLASSCDALRDGPKAPAGFGDDPRPQPQPQPKKRAFALDGSMVATLALAVLTLVLAGGLARRQATKALLKASLRRSALASQAEGPAEEEEEEEPALVISEKMALLIVLQATVGLLIFYFFLSKIFFTVMLVFYALISTQSVGLQAASLFECVLERRKKKKKNSGRDWEAGSGAAPQEATAAAAAAPHFLEKAVTLPVVGPCRVYQLLSFFLGLGVAVTWSVVRLRATWAWVLQDLSGVCIILTILSFLKMPNLKIASILLSGMMFYDIFFVFIQPLLFRNESVMKKVATGGGTHEILPMALIIPEFTQGGAYSLLGYGDVAIPGLLCVYAAGWDAMHRLRGLAGYFWIQIAGYVCGICLTVAALAIDIGGQGGQPALCWLVPCMLGSFLGTAHWRGDLKEMWTTDLPFLEDMAINGGSSTSSTSTSSKPRHHLYGEGEEEGRELLINASP